MEIYKSLVLENDMFTKKNPKKINANLIKYQVENRPAFPGQKFNFHM